MMTHVIVAAVLALSQAGGLVDRTFSGDTLVVAPLGKPDRWVRLVGVGVPGTPDAGKPAPFLGRPDPPALAGWLEGRPVALVPEPRLPDALTRRDLAYAHAGRNRADVGLELIKAGYAYVRRDQDFERKDQYLLAEAEARAAGRGYWPTPPPPEPEPARVIEPVFTVVSSKEATAARQRAYERWKARRARQRSYGASVAGLRAQMWGDLMGGMARAASPPPPSFGGGGSPGTHWVRGHMRGGTWVNGYRRSNPDGNPFNNLNPP
jgi:endonuclease YncB( thermonuclease family)